MQWFKIVEATFWSNPPAWSNYPSRRPLLSTATRNCLAVSCSSARKRSWVSCCQCRVRRPFWVNLDLGSGNTKRCYGSTYILHPSCSSWDCPELTETRDLLTVYHEIRNSGKLKQNGIDCLESASACVFSTSNRFCRLRHQILHRSIKKIIKKYWKRIKI